MGEVKLKLPALRDSAPEAAKRKFANPGTRTNEEIPQL